jgi:hypothetical protein
MADRDWYTSNVARGWRGAARRIEEGDGPERVGDLAIRAMARDVRESGGIDGLNQLASVLAQLRDGMTTPRAAFEKMRQVEMESGGRDLIRIATDAARQMVAKLDRGIDCGDIDI